MSSAARVDELWNATAAPPGMPYMEANRWLRPFIPTDHPPRTPQVSDEIEFLGKRITWRRNGDEPFPEQVLNLLMQFADFRTLEDDWDSYGGVALRDQAIEPALTLLFAAHMRAFETRIVPLSDGGVGLRWASPSFEFEVDVSGDGVTEGSLEMLDSGEVEEIEATTSTSEVVAIFDRLCCRR